jgi:hypothetical protein
MSGREFRTFVHPPSAMVDGCRGRGLQRAFTHPGAIWQIEGLVRPA